MDPTAAEANRRFYADLAPVYDETEHCINCRAQRDRLRRLLDAALELAPPAPSTLDACGGSGNAAELLADRGLRPVVVDVSAEMLARWRAKAAERGLDPEVHVSEIDAFLRSDQRDWDLIVFSSALHHLEDYREVLALAAERLSPSGLIATSYDPIRTSAPVRLIMRLDWILWELFTQPGKALKLIGERLRRGRAAEAGPTIAQLAERHDSAGIDDVALAAAMAAAGVEVVRHDREAEARIGPIRFLLKGDRGAVDLLAAAPPQRPGLARPWPPLG